MIVRADRGRSHGQPPPWSPGGPEDLHPDGPLSSSERRYSRVPLVPWHDPIGADELAHTPQSAPNRRRAVGTGTRYHRPGGRGRAEWSHPRDGRKEVVAHHADKVAVRSPRRRRPQPLLTWPQGGLPSAPVHFPPSPWASPRGSIDMAIRELFTVRSGSLRLLASIPRMNRSRELNRPPGLEGKFRRPSSFQDPQAEEKTWAPPGSGRESRSPTAAPWW